MWRFIGLGGVAVTLMGCASEPFGCESDDQCQVDTASGFCEINGYCSFTDPECPSGRRYSNLAGGGLSGLCVVAPDETTDVGSSTGSGSTSVNPITGLTTELTSAGSDSSTSGSSGSSEGGESSSTDASSGSSSSTGGEVGIDEGLVVYVDFDAPADDDGGFPTPAGTLPVTCDNAGGGCPTPTDGVVGGAGHFDGVDDGVFVPDHPRLHLDSALTIALWARRTGPFNPFSVLIGKAFGFASANSYEIYLSEPNEIELSYVANFGTDSPAAFALIQAEVSNEWSHLCGVWDGAVWRLYLDGTQISASVLESSPSYDEHPFTIGYDTEGGVPALHFPGDIDEVRLYDRALSVDEVQQLASRG